MFIALRSFLSFRTHINTENLRVLILKFERAASYYIIDNPVTYNYINGLPYRPSLIKIENAFVSLK